MCKGDNEVTEGQHAVRCGASRDNEEAMAGIS